MVFVLAIAADVFLGVGWVLQQRVAAHTRCTDDPPLRALRRLIATPVWWGGIAAMAVGQSIAAWALQSGPVTLVEPMLVGCLLCAFGFAALRGNQRVTVPEVLGTLLVLGGIALFIGAGRPQADVRTEPTLLNVLVAAAAAAGFAAVIVFGGRWAGRRNRLATESAAFAAAAGVFYALQDVATRGAIDVVQRRDLASLVYTTWPYVLVAAATAGVLISQAAFRAARLDWSLPPTVAMQPIVGVAMAVSLLGDRLRLTPLTIALEIASLLLVLTGVLVVGRSLVLRRAHGLPHHRLGEVEPTAIETADQRA
jgi:drug/metabolite transporter (DMT)-like permease